MDRELLYVIAGVVAFLAIFLGLIFWAAKNNDCLEYKTLSTSTCVRTSEFTSACWADTVCVRRKQQK